MKGVKFDSLHSFYEWGLILQSKTIEAPTPKEYKIDIEGADGELDFTEAFGDVKYSNRNISMEFVKLNINYDGFAALYSQVQDIVHGQKMKIIFDDDPNHYYVGRVYIKEWKSEKSYGKISITVDAEPYKLQLQPTTVTHAITGTAEIVLANSRMPVVPKITTDAAMTFSFGGITKAVNAGTFSIPELELKQGNNSVNATGTGNVTFKYQEGRL